MDDSEGIIIHIHHGVAYAYRPNQGNDGIRQINLGRGMFYMNAEKLMEEIGGFTEADEVFPEATDDDHCNYLKALHVLDEISGRKTA